MGKGLTNYNAAYPDTYSVDYGIYSPERDPVKLKSEMISHSVVLILILGVLEVDAN